MREPRLNNMNHAGGQRWVKGGKVKDLAAKASICVA
jgi:hypothetical protein